MVLRLPKFEDTRCCLLTACGQLLTEDERLLQWLGEQRPIQARYRAAGRSGHVRMSFGGKLGKHVHVDVATKEWFRASAPTARDKVADIRQAIGRIEGQQVDVFVSGSYRLPQSDLPRVVRSTLLETEAGGVALKTTGGTLAVRGAPIQQLEWWVYEDRDDARIRLSARTSMRIDDSYLDNCLAIVDSGFEALVLGE